MDPSTRKQPRRAVRDKSRSRPKTELPPTPRHALISGDQNTTAAVAAAGAKRKSRGEAEQQKGHSKKRWHSHKTTEPPQEPITPASTTPAEAAPEQAKGKKPARKKRKRAPRKFMDDFLASDAEEPEEEEEGYTDVERSDQQLRRKDRWVPDMEHRSRPTTRPKGIPHALWMSYCLLDDYIYRHSLTPEEIRTHPLMDDVYMFQSGGPQPVTPAGFRWNDYQKLEPIRD
ncbi:uncharacterized protein GGS25DRAFT_532433 [Hypoxylon fragiforme]|uniref:uncharacterized protein n=1 Tax=Hypoxylon fragiforme TaxID=63214 RepID=UPI0020C67E41|nr:uncharacterized protein GGS25DRAFT_532433 [Hypoxylon fragiforme]KAI2607238.1 hypothetical protein GGS25DRAFT_532433 [Hypoxylon fragiforme]